MPPRTETIAFACGASSAATASSWAGLCASRTTSACCATSTGVAAVPPSSSASADARPEPLSAASTGSPQPRAIARAMFPAPISPIRTVGTLGPPAAGLALVEEALLDQFGALLGRDLDVARREEEHLVGDPLHAAVERVGEAAGEVDQPLGEVGVRALEVQDHRDPVLELVRDVLRVVEGLGDDEVHADVVRAPVAATSSAATDGSQHAGATGLDGGVVGEDVVDLVAAAPGGQAADVRALALPVTRLGLGPGLLVGVGVPILGQAEVDERAVP